MEMNETVEKPYWLWACQQSTASGEWVDAGEMLLILLDRLEDYGINTGRVKKALRNLAAESGHGKLRKFAALFGAREKSESKYEELRELSVGLFEDILTAGEPIQHPHGHGEPADSNLARLRQALEQTLNRFKAEVLKVHPSYFVQGGWREPVHLGYLVYCVGLMEQLVARLSKPLRAEAAEQNADAVKIKREMLSSLLDWTGDYRETEYFFWRRELNEIMGIG